MQFFTGIDRKNTITQDIRLDFANMLYLNSDIRGLHLAEKIYNSDGSVDFSEDEISLMKNIVNQFGTAMIVDAFNIIFSNINK